MPESCPHCGSTEHGMFACPRIKSIEYHPGGGVKKIELHEDKPEITWQHPPEDRLDLNQ